MSIYCSIFGIGEEHSPRCKRIVKVRGKRLRIDTSQPCNCRAYPIKYDHSGVLPSAKDKRDGCLGLGAIPGHIQRNGKSLSDDFHPWYPWLRVSLQEHEYGHMETVVLTRKQVTELRDALTQWLEYSDRGKASL